VEDPAPRPQQLPVLLELLELVGRARAEALLLRALVEPVLAFVAGHDARASERGRAEAFAEVDQRDRELLGGEERLVAHVGLLALAVPGRILVDLARELAVVGRIRPHLDARRDPSGLEAQDPQPAVADARRTLHVRVEGLARV